MPDELIDTTDDVEWGDLGDPPAIEGRGAAALVDADEHIRSRNWHLARIAEAEAVCREVVARASQVMNRVRARHLPRAEWHETAVVGLHRALLAEDGKRKTIELPHGTMKARKARDLVEVDVAVTVPWLSENMPWLLREPPVDKAGVNRAVKAGADIPGVAVTEGEVEFSISVDIETVEADQ